MMLIWRGSSIISYVLDYFVMRGGFGLTVKRLQRSSLYEYLSIWEFVYLKLRVIDTICSRRSTFVSPSYCDNFSTHKLDFSAISYWNILDRHDGVCLTCVYISSADKLIVPSIMVAWGTAAIDDIFSWMTNDLFRYCHDVDVLMQHIRGIVGVSGHISFWRWWCVPLEYHIVVLELSSAWLKVAFFLA